jgi:hypothetical protein
MAFFSEIGGMSSSMGNRQRPLFAAQPRAGDEPRDDHNAQVVERGLRVEPEHDLPI